MSVRHATLAAFLLLVLLLSCPRGGASQTSAPAPPPAEVLAGLLDPAERPGALAALERLAALEEELHWLHLLAVLRRSGNEGTELAVSAAEAAVLRGDPDEGARLVEAGLLHLPGEERTALLAYAALLVESGDPSRAAALRARLLAEDPEAPQAAAAALHLARWLIESGGDLTVAVELLEGLLVADPGHPVAPEARRLLGSLPSSAGGPP